VQKNPFIYSKAKGGECMDFILSLMEIAAKVVFKVTFTTLVKDIVSRIKERTAPMNGRDDSGKK